MRGALGFIVLSLLLAGCTASSPPPTSTAASKGTQSVASSDPAAALGTIEGIVTNDEMLPIPDATVGLIKLGAEVRTDAAGAFRFTEVPTGTHELAAHKIGYDTLLKKVDVVADEVTRADFTLVALALTEPFAEILPHAAMHHVGATQFVTWAYNLTGDGSLVCSGCQWIIRGQVPEFMMIEISGQHSVASPTPAKEYIWVFQNDYDGGAEVGRNDKVLLPGSVTFAKDKLGAKAKQWWAQILCDTEWVCYEEKRDIWVTLFHDFEEVPEGYTARPPP